MTLKDSVFSARTALLLGDDACARLKDASIAVIGVGGVGAHAAEALVRAGIGSITLVDDDCVHPSNINRQTHALTSTVGQPKVRAMADRLIMINPALAVNPQQFEITPENTSDVLSSGFDLVIDAIDTFSSKLALLQYCNKSEINVISSMGSAGKLDPSRVKIGDISESQGCPLARKLRRALRREGIDTGITVVYSDEPFDIRAMGEPSDGYGSRRAMGSISYMPAIFGLNMAAAAILRITMMDKKF